MRFAQAWLFIIWRIWQLALRRHFCSIMMTYHTTLPNTSRLHSPLATNSRQVEAAQTYEFAHIIIYMFGWLEIPTMDTAEKFPAKRSALLSSPLQTVGTSIYIRWGSFRQNVSHILRVISPHPVIRRSPSKIDRSSQYRCERTAMGLFIRFVPKRRQHDINIT